MDRGEYRNHFDSEAYENIPATKQTKIQKETSEGRRRQRRLLIVLVTLLVFVFMFLVTLTSLMFIYYSRILEAMDIMKHDILQIRKESRKCDSNWKAFDGSCYYIVTTEKNWTEAQTICKSMNSDLVIINSEKEQKFLENITNQTDFWIGLQRYKDGWRWVDGTLLNSSDGFWMKGEPNNKNEAEDCVHMWIENKWNDENCTLQQKAFCEK
ncbi:hepatic lectin [Xenopus laevis]|uniref:Hepatic lectin n=2 Tax=Xenopus laevis TaxID=8355 RepID=A0A1L8H2I4_XENLA|nr:hepatic lectin [Xenopus laevis]OCT90307.1 hypothetical protein XELAEV_18018919mg [Xenopus laevis]